MVFSLLYRQRFFRTWKFMLVQKIIRRIDGIKIHSELPNAGMYLLAEDVENSNTEIKIMCLLQSYIFIWMICY